MLKRHSLLLHSALISVLFAGGLTLSGCETAAPSKPASQVESKNLENTKIIKSPNDDREYAALLLPNGLQVVLVSDPSLENSAASLAVGVGSAQNPETQLGLAHYLEHMLFLGTEKFPEPDGFMKYTQANGGMTNAFTAFDKTNYMFQINAGKFDEALDRFSDYFKKPTFDATYSDKERNAVNNEWSLQKAQDPWNLYVLQGFTANPKNPSAKFTIGNLDTLKDKPGSTLYDEMKKFYEAYYSANIMKLTLVGKQPIAELKVLAQKHFASIPNKNVPMPDINVPGLTENEMGKSIHYKPIKELKMLFVDFPVVSNKDQWALKPNEFIHNLLTSEEAGTLGEQLRAKGLVKGVTAMFNTEAYGPDGILRVQAELTDAGLRQQDDVIAAIFSYIDLIKRKGLDQRYYQELQAMRKKDFASAPKPDPLQQAVNLTMQQFDLPVENLLNSEYVYERYDVKAIKNVLAQLDEKRARIWYVNPSENVTTPIPYFDGKYDVRDIADAQYKKWDVLEKNYQFNLPPLNDLFTDKQAPIVDSKYLKPHQVVSQPGMEAFLVHPEFHREDKGQLSLQLNVDFAKASARQAVLAALLNEIFNKQNMTLVDRAARASLTVELQLLPTNSQGIVISGYTTKHELLLTELLQNFVNLSVSDQWFLESKDTLEKNLLNLKKNHVFRQLFGDLGRLTTQGSFTADEQLAALTSITKSDLASYHDAVKKNALLRLLAVGNYTEEQVKHFAKTTAGILPSARAPENRAVNNYVTPTAGKVFTHADDVELADSAVLQVWFADKKSYDEVAQLAVLDALFGNAFFMQLRTNEQLGYVVTSSVYEVDQIPGFFMLVQSSNTDLPGIKARMDKFRKDYLVTLKATDEKEVEEAKQALIANILQKPTDFLAEASRYTHEFWQGKYAFDAREQHLAALKKVTKADIVRVYESLLLNEKAGKALLQLRGTNFKQKPFAKSM